MNKVRRMTLRACETLGLPPEAKIVDAVLKLPEGDFDVSYIVEERINKGAKMNKPLEKPPLLTGQVTQYLIDLIETVEVLDGKDATPYQHYSDKIMNAFNEWHLKQVAEIKNGLESDDSMLISQKKYDEFWSKYLPKPNTEVGNEGF